MPRPTKLGPHDPPGVGPYTFLARLGRGGQGEVYLAADDDGNRVAVKVLRVDWDASGVLKRNLDRELVNARKVAQFVTARVLDFDVVGEVPYIVSEYIEGPTLAERIREQGPLGGSELMLVASQALTALEAIHHARVIHCDFKPANIILGQGGARVIDFGIAKALDSTHRVGHVAGTVPYMAPEQVRGETLTPAVDLFAWGATFVFAATDQPAFPGEMREEIMNRILRQPPELHHTEEPLRTVVRACLQKRPERRPTAAQARRILLGPPRSAAPGPRVARRPPGNPTRRAPGPMPGAAPPRPAATRLVPQAGVAASRSGIWKGATALIAAVAAAVVVALTWAIPRSSDGQTASVGSSVPVPGGTPAGDGLLQAYEDFWPGASCVSASPPPQSQVIRRDCRIDQDGMELLLFCSRYHGMSGMRASGRPGGKANGIGKDDIYWRNDWYRGDSGVYGGFIAYRLSEDRDGIWWEDSTDPIACMIHGPQGSTATMVTAFTAHEFKLRSPVTSGP